MKTIRLGVFGCRRGTAFMDAAKYIEGAKVTAICEKDVPVLEDAAKNHCEPDVLKFTNWNDFINCGQIDAVVLVNYFNEHAQYAIDAMEHGFDVLSETMAASTMALCVKLCRTVEKTGKVYMFAENYPFCKSVLEMRKIYQGGSLGKLMYSEGEYVHPMTIPEHHDLRNPATRGQYHWRRYEPATYYSSHALAPIMYVTNTFPKTVVGMCANDTAEHYKDTWRVTKNALGILLCQMDDGSICRITGNTYMGPHGNWYRLSCVDGGIETRRFHQDEVELNYCSWAKIPKGKQASQVYAPQWQDHGKEADAAGHSGGDFWTVYNFVQACREGKSNFFDVYTATMMSATAILAWKSVLKGSKAMKVPDLRKEAQRKKWENDNDNPFPSDAEMNNIPYDYGKLRSSKIKKN